MRVDFVLGRGKTSSPELQTADSFNAFRQRIIAKRTTIAITPDISAQALRDEKAKLFWFAPPVKEAGMRRIKENMAACAFGGYDFDACTPGAVRKLTDHLPRYSAFSYQTASHTPQSPRIRLVVAFSRLVQPDERRAVCEAFEGLLMADIGFTLDSVDGSKATWTRGDDYLLLDRSVYGAQSFLYCPDSRARAMTFDGAPVDVDALSLPAAAPVTKRSAETKPKPKSANSKKPGPKADAVADFGEVLDAHLMTDLRSALWHPEMLKKAFDNAGWIAQGYRLASLKNTEYEDEARQLFIDWSATAQAAYEEDLEEVAAKRWDALKASTTNCRAIFNDAQDLGWVNRGAYRLRAQLVEKMAASQRGALLAEYYGDVRLKADGEMVHRYNGQIWGHLSDGELKRQMAQIFCENEATFNPRDITNAVDTMKWQIPLMGEASRHLVGFANGVYDLNAKTFRAHKAEDWLTTHNGIVYTPPLPGETLKAHAPMFYQWLMHCADGEERKAACIKAGLFMVLANRYDWQLFLEVTGTGGSGKSVFTGIATLLAGEHNAESGSMAALDSAREREPFVGKSLITLPDQVRYVGAGSGIKAVTGGDSVLIDPKHLKPYSLVLKAVVIITNNEPMSFTERQGGIARRRVIFPFNHSVTESQQDPLLIEKISTEVPVIVRSLLAEFSEPERAKRLLVLQRDSSEALAVKNINDPLYGFCEHLKALENANGMYMGNNRIPSDPRVYLYHAYLTYLEACGHQRPLTLTTFGRDLPVVLKEYGTELKKAKKEKGVRYNLELAESAEEWLQDMAEDGTLAL